MIYLASSMRNELVPRAAHILRQAGFEVFDLWYNQREFHDYAQLTEGVTQETALTHPMALAHHKRNKEAMDWCDRCVLLNPCGNSAHLEAGYMIGSGKPTIIVGGARGGLNNYEIMYRMATRVFPDLDAVEKELCFVGTGIERRARWPRIRQQLFE